MNEIKADKLSFSYEEGLVLDNLSFSVEEGEFIGLIGPNGGGKTTLLYLLMGFLKPLTGSLTLFGMSPKKARTMMGWVPQNFLFDRHFPITVSEVVLMGRLSRQPWYGHYDKSDREEVLNALEKLGMADYADSSLAALSAGQAQRVFIARALVGHPKILLLDEPTSSIDMHSQEEIYKFLEKLKKEMTILMVTHDLRAVSQYVERIFCVQKELSVLSKEEVCAHFAMGVYHPPLKESSS